MSTTEWIQDLVEKTRHILNRVEVLQDKELDELNWRPEAGAWSALECVQHLNLYCRYYLPGIEKAIRNSTSTPRKEFTSGKWGRYFANSMLPKGKLKPMRTFREMNPLGSQLNSDTLHEFLRHQHHFLELLQQSSKVDIQTVKVPTSFTRLIRLRLGDLFLFLVNHNLRHLNQLERVCQRYAEHRGTLA